MISAILAERLLPDRVVLQPFPHFVRDDALPEELAGHLLEWMETRAKWRLHTASFFEQYELDLTDVTPPECCRIVFETETLAALADRYGAAFNRRMTGAARVTAHRLLRGQTIGVHTDEPQGDRETHRLLVQLNRGWREHCGGELLLLTGKDIETLHSVIQPHHNRAIGFEMSDHSFHAVARVRDWTRYTLIFSFWASDRPIPALSRHVPMPQRERVLAFLRDHGAAVMGHSGGSFLDHLKGVERILDRWGAPLETRLAGLMHSIYGTEGFPIIDEVNRTRVEELVGPQASSLIALFCTMDHKSLVASVVERRPALRARDGTLLQVTQGQIDALTLIHLANIAEQLPRLRDLDKVVSDDMADYRRVRPFIPHVAAMELDTLFDRLSAQNTDRDVDSVIEALRTFIMESGGEDVLFGQTTLLGHLSLMEEWLAQHGAAPALRIAALAHGLFGWKADLTEQNRAIVRVVAGDMPERLAWLFAAADNAAVTAAALDLDDLGIGQLELAGVGGRRERVTRDELASIEMLSLASQAAT